LITLYDGKETDFNNNGLVVLSDNSSCSITEELNGTYELSLEYPLDTRGKWQYLLEGNIIKADGQLFRIYRKIKNLTSIKINARHIYYDLLDNFLEDVRPTNITGYGALNWILTHTQYSHPFISMGDVGGNDTRYFVRKNPVEAIMSSDGIIANWGGELVRDNFTIKLLNARGLDRGVLAAYGKNIQGIEETLDIDGICTRLMPIGKDGLLLSEKYIDSPYINNFPHPKIKVVELNDYETEGTLRTAATSYMINNKIDIPQFNYKIDFLELSKTEEYKNYAVLERVYLGDTVTIKHSKLNINLKAKVIKITKNVLTGRIEKIELGSFKANIATSINNTIQEVRKDIVQVKSDYQKAIDNATELITGSKGGNVVIRQGEDGKPYEILIMDTTDVMTANNVWRWNLGGFGHSSTGVNGPYGTAITQDGAIIADYITAGIINGLTINGSTINGATITGSTISSINTLTIGAINASANPKLDFNVGTSANPSSFNTNMWLGIFGYPSALNEYDSLNIEVKSPQNDSVLNHTRAKVIIKGKGYGQFCDLNVNGKLQVITPDTIFQIGDDGKVNTNGGAIATNGGNITTSTGSVTANYFYGKIDATNVKGQVDNALSAYLINTGGDPAVVRADDNNYAVLAPNGMFSVIIGGQTRFTIDASGTKIGGTIEIDEKNWGMSPVDSPRILISDLIIDQVVSPEGVEVFLDEKLSKAINGYAVFPSRSDISITNKKAKSFIVSGTGIVDLHIIGTRIGEEEVYWVEMPKPVII